FISLSSLAGEHRLIRPDQVTAGDDDLVISAMSFTA
ncbi:hypothetical protein A2U01_0112738, partial [Trifolium medium]|nr:hypothetical protein [Trifolium medium]